jgi:hypothetical protein
VDWSEEADHGYISPKTYELADHVDSHWTGTISLEITSDGPR